ncbi:putative ABC-type antimicrobial peptide transport system, permease component [Vibrio nigripulchritudo SFn27]|uniref:Putative ABC-type antimicrobial peptide transport system, permease component n=1 Tax=Vibrio nigripulchritudo TaxID=28173 RepID=U4JX85_9VIBR|nr:FtsX-like permease family protein [Vibrio nigripulchritudo]CCN85727.1 putative ABC-type antimicrobial peptide transport system, permease component [Vibrio nigripulchritudo BLFn1]CCN86705.1 putative ABC-type antimicrobial peptide transport system, permease component [Vibrio nigripulchritudo SFn27]CCN95991.1 putative ABC-type antimicrobial peptide transport system, permease component [Vibrio nigripulchritudo ENn2]CCO43322.1 putative ABC-type antimicrobial peptide transport system, permease com
MLIKLAWRNLWRNKIRTGIMLGAMVFGLLGVVSIMGFMNGLMDSMLSNAISWQTSHIQIHQRSYIDNPDLHALIPNSDSLKESIESKAGVKAVSSRFLVNGMIASARSTRGTRINGVNLHDEKAITPLSDHLTEGEWLSEEGRNPVLVSEKTAQRLKLRIGSKVVLTFSGADNEVAGAAFRVRGIFKTPSSSFDDGNLYVRKSDLSKIAGLEGAHEIAILLKDASKPSLEAMVQDLEKLVSSEVEVRGWQKVQPLLASMQGSMATSNTLILGVFVIAMGFGIVNILLMSVFERTREFGVLMAVGMQKHRIFTLILLEATLLGALGALLGVLSSIALISTLHAFGLDLSIMSDALGAYGVDTMLYPRIQLSEYQLIVVTVVVASIVAALYPARQILKKQPVQAMSEKH